MNVSELTSKNNKQVIDTFIVGYIPKQLIFYMKITKYLQYKMSRTFLG
jgi:hypothetical protein